MVRAKFLPTGPILGAAVGAEGIAGLLRPVGAALLAVEHKVGAHLQQATAGVCQGLGKGPRRVAIHRLGQLRFAFGLVHGGVSAGVEHPVGPVLQHSRAAGSGIGQIQGQQASGGITAAAGGDQLHPHRQLLAQSVAELAGVTREHAHYGMPSWAGFGVSTDAGHG